MKLKNILKAGDILYRVDPRKLSIKTFEIRNSDELFNYTTTTYENFAIECDKKAFQVPLDEFPIEFKGLFYFLSEDEANDFIRRQIGM